MANQSKFYSITDSVTLTSFSKMPSGSMKFWQQYSGTRYYRLKCEPDEDYMISDFPTFYLYLGTYDTVPNYDYHVAFTVQSVKNANAQNTTFEALFTQYSTLRAFRMKCKLESSSSSTFPSSGTETFAGTRVFTIWLSNIGFGPTWATPSWTDVLYSDEEAIHLLTGSDRKGAQGYSRFRFDYPQATARYGTSIEKYSITIAGGFSASYTPSQLEAAEYHIWFSLKDYKRLVGDTSVTFSVEDTRGMVTSHTLKITIVPYKELYLTADNIHRQGGTGSTLILDFEGSWWGDPLTLTCSGISAYEEGSSTAVYTLDPTVTVSDKNFSCKTAWSGASFDPAKAYTVRATFTDGITEVVIVFPIPVGTPVLAIRDKKVGINNSSPDAALDVSGTIRQNGFPIMGYAGEIKDEVDDSVSLNDYTDGGIYIYSTLASQVSNFPDTNRAFILEVIRVGDYVVQKLFYMTGGVYIRTRVGYSWGSWQQGV